MSAGLHRSISLGLRGDRERDDIRLFLTPDELAYGLDRKSKKKHVFDGQNLFRLIGNNQGPENPIVLFDHLSVFSDDLPAPAIKEVNGNFDFMVF